MENVLSRISRRFEAKGQSQNADNESLSLYLQLYALIKDAIIDFDLPPGSILPSTRQLAGELKISRTTVIRSYELLKLERYIDSQLGSGHIVREVHENLSKRKARRTQLGFQYPPLSETGRSFLQNITLINSTDDKSIAFRPGLPPLDIFPVNQWKNLSNLYWRYIKSSALSYSPSSGIEYLKRNIAAYLSLNRNIKCDPEQIIIVSGSLQSLFLIGSVVLNPGDTAIIENPTFPNVHSIFKSLRAQIGSVGLDDEGLNVHLLKEEHHKQAKLLHCTPSCHYPKGTRMTLSRRQELLKWGSENECFIVENDYEHEIHNHNNHTPSLYSLDSEQRVIYLSTFNRLLHPSLRLGYMIVPYFLLDAVEALLKHSHRFVPPSIQVVMNQFIEKHYLHSHIKRVVEVAEEREQLFRKTFTDVFEGSVVLHKNATRSLHILAEIEPGIDDRNVVSEFAKQNIIAHSLSKCYTGEVQRQGFIMGYSSVRPPVMKDKVQQMAKRYLQCFP